MISNYEIKNNNNEEILYIYLDFNTEFAKIKNKKKRLKLKKEIKDYIKKNNINFKGTTVAIIVGGIMIGTIMLNKPKYNNTYSLNDNYTISLINKDMLINNLETEINTKDSIKDKDSNQNTNKTEIKTKEENVLKINETNKIIKEDNIILNTSKEIANNEIKEEIDINISSNIKEEVPEEDNNTYITIYRKSGEVLKLELEEYLIGVVSSEMPASFNIEALKAQAIISRTYTLKSIETNKRLTDTSSTQVYKDNNELKSIWGSNYNAYYNKIKSVVDSTKGIVLTYNGNLIEAVYHSTSNGRTENSDNVWKYSFPYLVSVDSPYDSTNKSFIQTIFFTYEELSNKLNSIINIDTNFNITNNESNRVKNIEFNNIILTGVEFRTKLNLRSTDFILEKTTEGINITTKGYGHGVGLSQYGANGMANNGANYETILKHYYTGVNLSYK